MVYGFLARQEHKKELEVILVDSVVQGRELHFAALFSEIEKGEGPGLGSLPYFLVVGESEFDGKILGVV